MEITFIRHAESVANAEGKWQGQSNSPLTREGRRQARALALRLARERYDLVLASDLDRTQETAGALARPLELAPEWRELDVGGWEGLTQGQVAARFAHEQELLATGRMDVPIGGGESWHDVRDRAVAALTKLTGRLGPDDRALVVSHGGIIATLVGHLLGTLHIHPRPLGRLTNTSITRLRVDGSRMEVTVFNDAGHITPWSPSLLERVNAGNAIVALVADPSEAQLDRLCAFHARIAARYGKGLGLPPPPEDLAAHHGGEFVSVAEAGHAIAEDIAGRLGVAPGAPAVLGPGVPGSYSHIAVSSKRTSLFDHGQSGHLPPA